jgi:hypothetical protein
MEMCLSDSENPSQFTGEVGPGMARMAEAGAKLESEKARKRQQQGKQQAHSFIIHQREGQNSGSKTPDQPLGRI